MKRNFDRTFFKSSFVSKTFSKRFGMKGYLYTLEVLMTTMLIFVTFAYTFRTTMERPELEAPLIKEYAYRVLKQLDDYGSLRSDVYTYNAQIAEKNIESDMRDYMPKKIGFEIEICTTSDSCSQRNVPSGKSIFVFDYYLSGWKSYDFKRIRVYLWKNI